MNKKLLLTSITAIHFFASAQQSINVPLAEKLTAISNSQSESQLINNTSTSSTLKPASLMPGGCGTSLGNTVYYSITQHAATSSYTIDAYGYAYGTNVSYINQGFGTYTVTNSKCAQKYNVTGIVTINDIILGTAVAKSDAAIAMVNAKIYSENPSTKSPDTQLGTTASKALNSFVNHSLNSISFSPGIVIAAGNFFAAIESPEIGGVNHDSLAIYSTLQGCSSTDSLAWTFRQLSGVGMWNSVVSGNPARNLDLMIYPVVEIPAGLNNSISKGNLTLLAAFPNPSTNEVSINFGLNTTGKVEIDIYDLNGKVINAIRLDNLQIGEHSSKVNVSNLSSGIYMYSVKSDNAKIYSKFSVTK